MYVRGENVSAKKSYYWLKLKRDFFKRHDIQIIEAMPNGKDYILFYLKMLVESVDHEGGLRFSEFIPYDETMLSTITNTNVDIVRSAMRIFTELKMIEILNDKTIYMSEVNKMLGTETYWAEQKRRQRIGHCPPNVQHVQPLSNQELDIEIEKELEKDGEIEEQNTKFIQPSFKQVKSYCDENNFKVDPQRFIDFYTSNGWMVGKNPMVDWQAVVRRWDKTDDNASKSKKSHTIEKESKYTEDELEEILLNKSKEAHKC